MDDSNGQTMTVNRESEAEFNAFLKLAMAMMLEGDRPISPSKMVDIVQSFPIDRWTQKLIADTVWNDPEVRAIWELTQ